MALFCAAFAAFAAAPAEALVVPQQGIDGIKLNMTRAEVVRAKGKPDAEKIVPNEIVGRQRVIRYGATRVFFGSDRLSSGVVTVNTRDPRQKTRSGVGIRSTEAELRAGVAGVSCRTEFGSRSCLKGRLVPGQRVTSFLIENGRVDLVVIGFVID